ncbi:MAG: hypothetical protein ACP5VE_08195 [Chthonomonadales bacterium]
MNHNGYHSNSVNPDPERSRRLEEIFADTPFLSATMRARLVSSDDVSPSMAQGEEGQPLPPFAAATAQEVFAATPPGMMSVEEARAAIRAAMLDPEAKAKLDARLQRLRDEALVPWLFEMRKAGWKG